MPSKSRKQLELFKLVKAYIDGGNSGLVDMWKKVYPNKRINSEDEFVKEKIQKIVDISERIDYADLEDLASGIEGDEVLGDKKEIKVGYWMRFEAWYKSYQGEKKKGIFIAKIKKIVPGIELVNFNFEDIYSKNGGRIASLRRTNIKSTDNIWLDFAYFNQIKETAKNKNDLIMKNEIRKIVREILNESEEEQDVGGLKIKDRSSDKEVSVKTGMLVQKISDESKGKIKNVGVDDSVPAKNNINVEWYYGDLAGTTQTVYPEDIYAMS